MQHINLLLLSPTISILYFLEVSHSEAHTSGMENSFISCKVEYLVDNSFAILSVLIKIFFVFLRFTMQFRLSLGWLYSPGWAWTCNDLPQSPKFWDFRSVPPCSPAILSEREICLPLKLVHLLKLLFIFLWTPGWLSCIRVIIEYHFYFV